MATVALIFGLIFCFLVFLFVAGEDDIIVIIFTTVVSTAFGLLVLFCL